MKFIDIPHDPWRTVGGEDGPSPHPIARPYQLLTLEQWHAVRDTWPAGLPTGLMLGNTGEVEEIESDLPRLALIVLDFPKWVDGRAYSQARILRSRYRFAGEIRATGAVLVDMLPLLQRTGFDAVVLRHDQSLRSGRAGAGLLCRPLPGRCAGQPPAVCAAGRPGPEPQARSFVNEGASI